MKVVNQKMGVEYPILTFDSPKPKLKNNGWNHYTGMPLVEFNGDTLQSPNDNGYVICEFSDGKQSFLFATRNYKLQNSYNLN